MKQIFKVKCKNLGKYIFGEIRRSERISITASLLVTDENKKYIHNLAQEVDFKYLKNAQCDDIASITYNFNLEYIGGIEKRFEKIIEFLNKENSKIVSVDYRELTEGKSLFLRVIKRIEELQEITKNRRGNNGRLKSEMPQL